MARKRNTYSAADKASAVKLCREDGQPLEQVAAAIGAHPTTVRAWLREALPVGPKAKRPEKSIAQLMQEQVVLRQRIAELQRIVRQWIFRPI